MILVNFSEYQNCLMTKRECYYIFFTNFALRNIKNNNI